MLPEETRKEKGNGIKRRMTKNVGRQSQMGYIQRVRKRIEWRRKIQR